MQVYILEITEHCGIVM